MSAVKFLRVCVLSMLAVIFSLVLRAQTSVPFSFYLSGPASTSAGVFGKDGTLLKTLWSGTSYTAGTHTATWNGTLDDGTLAPPSSYDIRILSNNVQYNWDGVIGNTSDATSGPTVQRFFERMYGMAIAGNNAYYSTGYNEGSPSQAKFVVSNPQVKIDVMNTPGSGTGQSTLYLTTDGTTVYYGGSDAFSAGNSKWFVYATKTADDGEKIFSGGTTYSCVYGPVYHSAINLITDPAANISGMAVQKTGNYLFVAHKNLNRIDVLDKNTGAQIRSINLSSPAGLSIDNNGDLWAIYASGGNSAVSKFTVQPDGSLSAAVLSLGGLVDPLAIAVSPDGNTALVADGGSSQQLKSYDNSSGAPLWTFGQAGGYLLNADVSNDKFYFSDLSGGIHETFLAFQADGSFWVGDIGNYRTLHFSANRNYLNQLMFLRHNYSVAADPNNPSRVFAEYLEFKVDYSKPLAPNNGSWTLVKNWRAAVPANYWREFMVNILKFATTLSNGRTYALLQNVSTSNYELVELPPAGPIRFTGFSTSAAVQILPDGSLARYAIAGLGQLAYWQKFPLQGFDASNNPQWTIGAGDTLATVPVVAGGDPVDWGTSPMAGSLTASNIVVSFDKDLIQNGHGFGYHLGGIRAGDNKWLWKTAKSTTAGYQGPFPADGSFDVGNTVQYPGGVALSNGRNIFWNYHGEFWKSSQVNKWNQVYDDGLFIGQFGVTGPEVTGQIAAPMMAGNVFSANLVNGPNGELYLYHNDESHHSAIHRWKITGLNTISEQTVPVSVANYQTGLMAQYYDNMQLNNFDLRKNRIDSAINNIPVPAEIQNKTGYSVRWTGYVLPGLSDTYSFYANTDKGVKVWVNGQLIIDNWTNGSQTESSGTIALQAGKRYTIRMDNNGTNASLAWSAGALPKQIIPPANLAPANPPDTSNGIDLMEGLPFNAVLQNNLYGWSRNPANEDYTGPAYMRWWSAQSGIKAYDITHPADVNANYAQDAGVYTINRDLGNNNVSSAWKIAGNISYEGNNANSSAGQGGIYFEVLDAAGKIITRFYNTLYWSNNASYLSINVNNSVLASDRSENIAPVLNSQQPLSITVINGKVTLTYANFPAFTTTVFDPASDWHTPKTMRLYFFTSGSNYSRAVDLVNMRFNATQFTLLDLNFLGVNAMAAGKEVKVNWKTDHEINTSAFVVERSTDGVSFIAIGTLPAMNQPGQHDYNYTDKTAPSGLLYYRIRMTDNTGKLSYSPVAAVNITDDARFSFYPNPVKDIMLVNFPSAGDGSTLDILSPEGKRLKTVPLVKGSTGISIGLRFLPGGMYFIRFNNKKVSSTTPFVRQ